MHRRSERRGYDCEDPRSGWQDWKRRRSHQAQSPLEHRNNRPHNVAFKVLAAVSVLVMLGVLAREFMPSEDYSEDKSTAVAPSKHSDGRALTAVARGSVKAKPDVAQHSESPQTGIEESHSTNSEAFAEFAAQTGEDDESNESVNGGQATPAQQVDTAVAARDSVSGIGSIHKQSSAGGEVGSTVSEVAKEKTSLQDAGVSENDLESSSGMVRTDGGPSSDVGVMRKEGAADEAKPSVSKAMGPVAGTNMFSGAEELPSKHETPTQPVTQLPDASLAPTTAAPVGAIHMERGKASAVVASGADAAASGAGAKTDTVVVASVGEDGIGKPSQSGAVIGDIEKRSGDTSNTNSAGADELGVVQPEADASASDSETGQGQVSKSMVETSSAKASGADNLGIVQAETVASASDAETGQDQVDKSSTASGSGSSAETRTVAAALEVPEKSLSDSRKEVGSVVSEIPFTNAEAGTKNAASNGGSDATSAPSTKKIEDAMFAGAEELPAKTSTAQQANAQTKLAAPAPSMASVPTGSTVDSALPSLGVGSVKKEGVAAALARSETAKPTSHVKADVATSAPAKVATNNALDDGMFAGAVEIPPVQSSQQSATGVASASAAVDPPKDTQIVGASSVSTLAEGATPSQTGAGQANRPASTVDENLMFAGASEIPAKTVSSDTSGTSADATPASSKGSATSFPTLVNTVASAAASSAAGVGAVRAEASTQSGNPEQESRHVQSSVKAARDSSSSVASAQSETDGAASSGIGAIHAEGASVEGGDAGVVRTGTSPQTPTDVALSSPATAGTADAPVAVVKESVAEVYAESSSATMAQPTGSETAKAPAANDGSVGVRMEPNIPESVDPSVTAATSNTADIVAVVKETVAEVHAEAPAAIVAQPIESSGAQNAPVSGGDTGVVRIESSFPADSRGVMNSQSAIVSGDSLVAVAKESAAEVRAESSAASEALPVVSSEASNSAVDVARESAANVRAEGRIAGGATAHVDSAEPAASSPFVGAGILPEKQVGT